MRLALAASLAASLPIAAAARFRVRPAMASSLSAATAAPAKVGVVQMTSVGDVDANYATCSRLTKARTLVSCSLPSHLIKPGVLAARAMAGWIAAVVWVNGHEWRKLGLLFEWSAAAGSLVTVAEAAASGVKFLCFPEVFSFIGSKDGEFDVDVPGNMVYKESRFTTAGA
ncbi:hypothetical protein PR202_gb23638 [Eleusine coracana subsp. coracana]|uniref:Uncharacterized protein n=1 Tax=Eleusine coracana subsp. coracana TaxID=191504 RepID=A0AAV5FJH6_ELECO|nr:hypothetical protein PR202_gb23638 [Eleusine coracana subsp. coracana]